MKKKKALGKGLGALIGEIGEKQGQTRFMLCSTDKICPNKKQPRKIFDEESLMQLADSIRENGIIEPLVVRIDGSDYELIVGERRWRAAKMLGMTEVPVVLMQASDTESLEYALVENIQREDLNPIEEAEAYQSLMNLGLSQDEVSKKVGKERTSIANYLRLLKLPSEVREELLKSTITMGHAKAILQLSGHAKQREFCKKIVKQGMSVRDAERLTNRLLARWIKWGEKQGFTDERRPGLPYSHLLMLEEEFRRVFGTKVSVKERNNKGSVEIGFYSPEERERVIELLRSIKK